MPLVSTLSTHPETTAGKRWAFRLAFLNSSQARVLADLAFAELGARRAAALVQIYSTYSVHLGEKFSQEFESRGGEMVAYVVP